MRAKLFWWFASKSGSKDRIRFHGLDWPVPLALHHLSFPPLQNNIF
jgi:hypothetical protein